MLWVPKGPTGVLAWVARPICMIKEAEQATGAVGHQSRKFRRNNLMKLIKLLTEEKPGVKIMFSVF
jgi:hypothetical protein